MCGPGQSPALPATAGEALVAISAGLRYLNQVDAAGLTSAEQADCLRGLAQAEATHTAARSRVLAAFSANAGYEDDGHGTAKTWLRWQTRITSSAAGAAVGWARRLAAHPAVARALGAGQMSPSWARQVCDWSDLLPEQHRADADRILLAAAAGGAELADLGALAEEMRRRLARPDTDDDGFEDRWVRLETTFRGAGSLGGELTPGCAAALGAVLAALGKKAGPEDTRTRRQRDHDALEEACRRLIASGCLLDRAGQPTQILLHSTLDQLRSLPGAHDAEAAWAGPAAPPGADCDAAIVPVITGRLDPAILDRLAAALLNDPGPAAAPGQSGGPGHGRPGPADGPAQHAGAPRTRRDDDADRRARAGRAARQLIITAAADLLSGPAGLASYLRTRLAPGIVASVSLPLDVGAITDTIPVHLRRAVAVRDQHCRFPGCHQPVAGCQPHHIIPRAQGGPTCLSNLLLLCTFHHLIAIHRWGWAITLHPDATTTATSPNGDRTLHSHSPPAPAAA